MSVADCIFCRIVAGEVSCARIHADEFTLTFMDIFPVTVGHVLIIPKVHCTDIFEARGDALEAVARRAGITARAIRATLAPDGLGVFQLNGAAAGQTVFHYHMHLIPRREGEPFLLHGRVRADDAELERIAAQIAGALGH